MRVRWCRVKKAYEKPHGGFLPIGPSRRSISSVRVWRFHRVTPRSSRDRHAGNREQRADA